MSKTLIIIIVIIVGFISLFYFISYDNTVTTSRPQNKQTDKLNSGIYNEIVKKINDIARNTEAKNAVLVQKTIEDISIDINQGFSQAQANIPYVIQKLAGFKGCATIAYFMAKDKVDHGSETEKFITEIIGQYIIEPSLKGVKESQIIIAKLNEQLAKNYTDMAVELASTSKTVIQNSGYNPSKNLVDFINKLNPIPEKTTEIAIGTLSSAFGIALEGVFIKSTISAAQRVLGSIAARTSTTVLASLAAAAADGPIPIGDIIGLIIATGGAVWTAYDLYKAQYVLKNEITDTLENSIREYRQKTISDFESEVRRMANEYTELNKRTVNELITKI